MWKGDQLLEQLYEQAASHRVQRSSKESAIQQKSRLRDWLQQAIGDFATTQAVEPIVLEKVQCEGYVRERIELSAIPGLDFAAYVLIPDGATGKLPGVFAVHGHGYGSRQICGMLPDGSPDPDQTDIYNHFAVQLVHKGMVVIVPDIIGFGERRLQSDLDNDPNAANSCYRMATQLLMMNKTLTGLRIKELRTALDYFYSRPELDERAVGMTGFSGGSLLAYILAALDERLKAVVLMGYPNTFKDSIMAVRHCLCNYTPGILWEAELPELIGLIAPRPLYLETGDQDPIFPEHGFRHAVEQLKKQYSDEGAQQNVAYDIFPGAHEVSGRHSFDWLKQQLERYIS